MKYAAAVYPNVIGSFIASIAPTRSVIPARIIASGALIAPDAIGLFFFSGCSLSLFRST